VDSYKHCSKGDRGLMDFGIFTEMSVRSVKIGNLKKFRMPSGKRRRHAVSGRHYDDR